MDFKALVSLVKLVSKLNDTKLVNSAVSAYFKKNDGTVDLVKFLDAIESAGVDRVFLDIPMDARQLFLKNVKPALRTHDGVAGIADTAELKGEQVGTTTANVAAFPVPLGQESPARKKKQESITRLMGIGAYQVNESISADEDLASLFLV